MTLATYKLKSCTKRNTVHHRDGQTT